jgi:hypothetical protein
VWVVDIFCGLVEVVSEEPTGEVHCVWGGVIEFDRVALRRVGVDEGFIETDGRDEGWWRVDGGG